MHEEALLPDQCPVQPAVQEQLAYLQVRQDTLHPLKCSKSCDGLLPGGVLASLWEGSFPLPQSRRLALA